MSTRISGLSEAVCIWTRRVLARANRRPGKCRLDIHKISASYQVIKIPSKPIVYALLGPKALKQPTEAIERGGTATLPPERKISILGEDDPAWLENALHLAKAREGSGR